VHIQHGRNKLPTISLPIEQGTVNLLTRLCPYSRLTHFSRVDPLTFEKVAVSDAVDKPAYVPLECFSVPVQPGQHVYTQATGRLCGAVACNLQVAFLVLYSMSIFHRHTVAATSFRP
jgi:hypothetical protein